MLSYERHYVRRNERHNAHRRAPGTDRGSRPGRTGGRHLALHARRGDDARGAPGRAVLAAARDRREPAIDGADPLLGRRGRPARGWCGRRVARVAVAHPCDGGRRLDVAHRHPDARAGGGSQPDRAAACPRTISSACCWSTCARWVALACTPHRGGGVEDLPEGVEVVLRDIPNGDLHTVRARYLVAADGAHSRIRTALGIAMPGPDGLAHVVTATFRAQLWQVVGDYRYGIYSVSHPQGEGSPATRRARRPLDLRSEGRPAGSRGLHARAVARRIRALCGNRRPRGPDRAQRRLQLRAQFADRFRAGRLPRRRCRPPGHPARRHRNEHRHPAGTTWAGSSAGCCAAGPAAAAGHVRDGTAARRRQNVGPVSGSRWLPRDAGDELHVDIGGRIPHVRVHSDESGVHAGPLGPGSRCSPDLTQRRRKRQPAGGPPVTVRRLDSISARAIGIRGQGALLVRPDGTPARLAGHMGPRPPRSCRSAPWAPFYGYRVGKRVDLEPRKEAFHATSSRSTPRSVPRTPTPRASSSPTCSVGRSLGGRASPGYTFIDTGTDARRRRRSDRARAPRTRSSSSSPSRMSPRR